MAVVRELLTILTFDVDTAGISAAEGSFRALLIGAKTLGAAVSTAAVGITAAVTETVFAANAADAAAKKLGLNVEEYQELEFAADRAGVKVASFQRGLGTLSKNADLALKGNLKLRETFAKIGVSVTDTRGRLKPAAKLLSDTANGLKRVSNAGTRTALATKLVGTAAEDLIPLLKKGSDGIEALRQRARLLGFVLDEDTVKAANEFSDSLKDLGLLALGLGRNMAKALLPALNRLTKSTIEWFFANRDLVDRGLAFVGRGVSDLIDVASDLIDKFRGVLLILEENKRFLFILAGVIAAVAVPAILGIAAAAIIAALPFLALLALAILVAAVIEEVWAFVTGDADTALQELIDTFSQAAREPGSHWMIKTIAAILVWIANAILAVDEFFRGFFEEAERLGGVSAAIEAALKLAFENAIDFWQGEVTEFVRFLGRKLVEAYKESFKIGLKLAVSTLPGGGSVIDALGDFAGASSNFQLPQHGGAAGAGGVSVNGDRNIQVTVNAPNADGEEVANKTVGKIKEAMEEERRDMSLELASGGVR